MTDDHMLSGLKRKRAEIAGIIADHERKAREWRAALGHVDAVLRMISSELDPASIPTRHIRRETTYMAGPDLARHCMDMLRKAEGVSITAKSIIDAAIELHGVPETPHMRHLIADRLRRYLTDKASAGVVVKHGMTHNARWSLSVSLPVPQDDAT